MTSSYQTHQTTVRVAVIFLLLSILLPSSLFAQYQPGQEIQYRNNSIQFAQAPKYDQQEMLDPVHHITTGTIGRSEPLPAKLNGQKIYRTFEVDAMPGLPADEQMIVDYVFRQLHPELAKLSNGSYRVDITNLVIDTAGRVVYYDGLGLRDYSDMGTTEGNENADKIIWKAVEQAFSDAPPIQPATLHNSPVPVLLDVFFIAYEIAVNNHNVTINKLWDNKPVVKNIR